MLKTSNPYATRHLYRQVATFFDKLEGNRTVTTLDLSRNLIGGRHEICAIATGGGDVGSAFVTGGRAMAEALRVNQTLTKLNLAWNQVGRDDVSHPELTS